MEDGTFKSVTHTDVSATASCEIRDLLDRLADKWSLLIIEMLGEGARRFSELHREIDQIIQRMLPLTLRHLERDGLVLRTGHSRDTPRADAAPHSAVAVAARARPAHRPSRPPAARGLRADAARREPAERGLPPG